MSPQKETRKVNNACQKIVETCKINCERSRQLILKMSSASWSCCLSASEKCHFFCQNPVFGIRLIICQVPLEPSTGSVYLVVTSIKLPGRYFNQVQVQVQVSTSKFKSRCGCDYYGDYDYESQFNSVQACQETNIQHSTFHISQVVKQKYTNDTSRLGVSNKPTQIDATATCHLILYRLNAGRLVNFFS